MKTLLSMSTKGKLWLVLTITAVVSTVFLWTYSSPQARAVEISPKIASKDINTLVSDLPILPPEKADKKFDTKLKLSGLPVAKFLSLLSREPFLDMNLVFATNSERLELPFDVALSDITVGELFNLVLQLHGLKAIRFNEKTLIIVDINDTRTYGVKERRTYHLKYFLPTKFIEFIEENEWLTSFFAETNFVPNDVQKNMLVVGSADKLVLVDYVVDLMDQKPNKVHAQIPLSNIEFDEFKESLEEMLPEDITATFEPDRWVYSETGRCIMVYDDPVTVEVLRKLVANVDIPPKQVLIDIALLEVSSTFTREIGMSLGSSSFTIDSLDKLFSLSRLSNALADINPAQTTVSYLLERSGGRALASPKVRVIDGESADINIGEIRNIRIQSTEFNATTGGSSQQTTYNTQEVPIGVSVNVEPIIHNDATVTLSLAISDEAVLSIQDYGVDRTTRNSTTILRIRDGETVIMGGYISQNRDWDKTPIPVLGNLPLIGRLFQAGKRNKLDTELVFLITPYILDYTNDKKEIKPKTMGDLVQGNFSENVMPGSAIKSTTTKWLEDDATKTKIVIDTDGKVVYKQSWSKETGTPIGDAQDLRSEMVPSANNGISDYGQFKENVNDSRFQILKKGNTATPQISREEYQKLRADAAKATSDTANATSDSMNAPVRIAPTPQTHSSEPAARSVSTESFNTGEKSPATSGENTSLENESWGGMLNSLDELLVNKGS